MLTTDFCKMFRPLRKLSLIISPSATVTKYCRDSDFFTHVCVRSNITRIDLHCVSFIVPSNNAALSYRKPAFAGIYHDCCRAQENDGRDTLY